MNATSADQAQLNTQRSALARQIGRWLETPMMVLGLAWLGLLIVDFTRGLNRAGEIATNVIWIVFIAEFALRFTIAPQKLAFLRRNWLTLVSLVVPALRVFRFFQTIRILRAARTLRGFRLVKVVASLNRGMRALRSSIGRRGFGYVTTLTVVVIFVGAAGMQAFENNPAGNGLNDYGSAVWWTAMIVTTMGSDYWPQSVEGRVLCILLSLYALGVLGYVAGALATFFIGRDAENKNGEIAGERALNALREEIAALRAELRAR
ncbi:hypothetical protein BH18VER1_BH18VER1_07280 [soil metagenome]